MKVAVVGNREGWEYTEIRNVLNKSLTHDDEIISGGAEGVDSYAQRFAKFRGLKITIIYPNPLRPTPERYFERNKQIIDMADRLIAFNTNKQSGTQNTINTAKKKGIPIMLIGKESV